MTALLSEVASVLSGHGDLRCTIAVESRADRRERGEGASVTLVVAVSPDTQEGLAQAAETLELRSELEYLRDVATMRALSARYGIPPQELEGALARARKEGL